MIKIDSAEVAMGDLGVRGLAVARLSEPERPHTYVRVILTHGSFDFELERHASWEEIACAVVRLLADGDA